jgi:hypothetical protein
MIADLVLAGGADYLRKQFPGWEQRRQFVRHMVARYAAFNVTWQLVDRFEDYTDARALMKEIGGLLKELDPYQHPRTTGARISSSPMLDDGWMDHIVYGTGDSQVGAVEHQLHPTPFVNLAVHAGGADPAAFRRRLWNATMDGQYVSYDGAGSPADLQAMTAWFDFMSGTRHWELEPYFDVDGGRALALEDVQYIVYIEKPGPLELTVEKHGYEILWVNPADGTVTRGKKFSGEHFTGEPPDRSHDWVLHVVREGRLEGLSRTFKFTSREHDLILQEVEANTPKVPFVIEQPTGELSMSKPAPYAVKITKPTRATRFMMYMWTGEVAAGNQGYRILATGSKGTFELPKAIATKLPADMHLRVYGMNANGKVYELDAAVGITQ